jgi:hypothetical protein
LIRGGIQVMDAEMISASPAAVVHLELHTRDQARAQPLLLAALRLVAAQSLPPAARVMKRLGVEPKLLSTFHRWRTPSAN